MYFIQVSGLEYEIVEWKMEWNSEYTQLQLTFVAGTVQPSLSYLLCLWGTYLTVEAVRAGPAMM